MRTAIASTPSRTAQPRLPKPSTTTRSRTTSRCSRSRRPRATSSRLSPDLMRSETRRYRTGAAEAVVDLTQDCADFVSGQGDGLLHVFVPHATAGIALIETGAGSDHDLLAALKDLLPADDRWRHRHGSPGHGRDHVMPAIVPPHATLPVIDGSLALGTWQSVCLVDTNISNHHRQVRLSFLA